MKYLLIFTHPNPDSLNAGLMQFVADHLRTAGHEVKVRDLYRLQFNPVLSVTDVQGQMAGQVAADVRVEQEFISRADCLVIIHPIWWTGLPAMMKGYIERVFSYGFAYRYEQGVQKGLLTGKQAVIINTQGKSHAEYQTTGMDKALTLTSDDGIYSYCGLTVKHHVFFDRADRTTVEDLEDWQEQLKGVFKDTAVARQNTYL